MAGPTIRPSRDRRAQPHALPAAHQAPHRLLHAPPRGRRRQCRQRRRRPRRGAPALLLPVHVSVTPFRSRPKLDKNLNDDDVAAGVALLSKSQSFAAVTARSSVAGEKKGIWGWRPAGGAEGARHPGGAEGAPCQAPEPSNKARNQTGQQDSEARYELTCLKLWIGVV